MARDIPPGVTEDSSAPDAGSIEPQLPPGVTLAAVRSQLERVLASEYFTHSDRLSRFLRFAVEQVLHGQANKLKEYLIGVEVFDRQENFDPRIDSIVRVEARRLRSKLDQYYEGEGRDDAVQIQFRKGRYVPAFRSRPRQAGKSFSEILSVAAGRDWLAVAVLPFESLSREPSHQFFADGLTQEVIASLTRLPGLRVAARTSSFQYRDRYPDIRRIGEELKVDALLTGSIRREGDRARVTSHLVHVAEGYYIWSDSYDCDASDVFAAQEEISRKILRAVGAKIAGQPEPEPHATGTVLPDHLPPGPSMKQAPAGGRGGEPAAPPSITARCFTLSLQTLMGQVSPEEARKTAAGYIAELGPAIESDPAAALAVAQAHAANWNWERAAAAFEQAIRLQPEDPPTRAAYGVYLALRGQLNEGLEEMRLAEELAPGSALLMAGIGWILYLKRDTARAVERYRDALAVDRELAVALCGLADADLLRHSYAEAVELAEKASRLTDAACLAPLVLARALVAGGRRADGERLLGEILSEAKRRYISPARIASVYAARGETEMALQHLDNAVALRCPELLWLPSDPAFDPIRADGRFGELMERLVSGHRQDRSGTASH